MLFPSSKRTSGSGDAGGGSCGTVAVGDTAIGTSHALAETGAHAESTTARRKSGVVVGKGPAEDQGLSLTSSEGKEEVLASKRKRTPKSLGKGLSMEALQESFVDSHRVRRTRLLLINEKAGIKSTVLGKRRRVLLEEILLDILPKFRAMGWRQALSDRLLYDFLSRFRDYYFKQFHKNFRMALKFAERHENNVREIWLDTERWNQANP